MFSGCNPGEGYRMKPTNSWDLERFFCTEHGNVWCEIGVLNLAVFQVYVSFPSMFVADSIAEF